MNRIGALWLASQLNGELPPEMRAGRIEQNTLSAATFELNTFVGARLRSLGMTSAAIAQLLAPTQTIGVETNDDEREYAASRDYFREWAGLSNDLIAWVFDGGPTDEIHLQGWQGDAQSEDAKRPDAFTPVVAGPTNDAPTRGR